MLQCFVKPKPNQKWVKKGATCQSFIRKEITCYRIGTLEIIQKISTKVIDYIVGFINIKDKYLVQYITSQHCCFGIYIHISGHTLNLKCHTQDSRWTGKWESGLVCILFRIEMGKPSDDENDEMIQHLVKNCVPSKWKIT